MTIETFGTDDDMFDRILTLFDDDWSFITFDDDGGNYLDSRLSGQDLGPLDRGAYAVALTQYSKFFDLDHGVWDGSGSVDIADDDTVGGWQIRFSGVTNAGIWDGPDDHHQGPPVPEPGTLILLGSGLAGMFAFRKRFRKDV